MKEKIEIEVMAGFNAVIVSYKTESKSIRCGDNPHYFDDLKQAKQYFIDKYKLDQKGCAK